MIIFLTIIGITVDTVMTIYFLKCGNMKTKTENEKKLYDFFMSGILGPRIFRTN